MNAPEIVVVGSVNADLRIEVGELPRPGQTIQGGSPAWFSGGKGANQAVALARLGRPVSLIGAVGSDPATADLARRLAAFAVRAAAINVTARGAQAAMPTREQVLALDVPTETYHSPMMEIHR
jgi:ribokinase